MSASIINQKFLINNWSEKLKNLKNICFRVGNIWLIQIYISEFLVFLWLPSVWLCCFKFPFLGKLITNWALSLISHFSLMNLYNVLLQIFFSWRTVTTNWSFIGFFPPWTDSMCCFTYPFCEKVYSQIEHLCCFFPSWTDWMCCVKVAFNEQL